MGIRSLLGGYPESLPARTSLSEEPASLSETGPERPRNPLQRSVRHKGRVSRETPPFCTSRSPKVLGRLLTSLPLLRALGGPRCQTAAPASQPGNNPGITEIMRRREASRYHGRYGRVVYMLPTTLPPYHPGYTRPTLCTPYVHHPLAPWATARRRAVHGPWAQAGRNAWVRVFCALLARRSVCVPMSSRAGTRMLPRRINIKIG